MVATANWKGLADDFIQYLTSSGRISGSVGYVAKTAYGVWNEIFFFFTYLTIETS